MTPHHATDQMTPPGELDPRSEESLEACPGCGSRKIVFLTWAKSRYREQWYSYERCSACALVFVNPRMPADKRQARVEASDGACQSFAAKADFDRLEFGWNMIGPVAKIMPPRGPSGKRRRWLDIGCAIGNLLEEAHRRGYEAHGLELNRAMVDWMRRERPYLHSHQGLLGDLPAGSRYDIVSLDNVLEHIHEPAGFLEGLKPYLAPGALFVVRVPNYNNFMRPLLEWTGRLPTSFVMDPDAHPLNYSRHALVGLLTGAGFQVERVMEHLMLSYPLKHVLGQATRYWPAGLRGVAKAAYRGCFLFDRMIPRGGIDITIIARAGRDD